MNSSKLSISQKTFLGMMAFGLGMGIIFPIYARFFTEYKEGMRVYFDIGCLIAGLVVGLTSYGLVKLLLLSQIKIIANRLREISEGDGDLNKTIDIDSKDCVGYLAINFNTFVGKIRAIVLSVTANSDKVSKTFTELFQTTTLLNTSTRSVSDKANSVAMAQEKSSANISEISKNAKNMSDSMNSIAIAVSQIQASIGELSEQCNKESSISSQAEADTKRVCEKMKHLETSVKEISRVTSIIDDIADRTNLLALNATIESASVGEAGKGFAVVANEVKALARQTSSSTGDITNQIAEIQRTCSETITDITKVSALSSELNSISQQIAAAVTQQAATITEVSGSRNISNTSFTDLARNIKEISQGLSEISDKISNVNQDITQTSTGLISIDNKVKNAGTIIKELSQNVNSFKTDLA